MKKRKIEKLIYKSMDGNLSGNEVELLKHELTHSAEAREEYRKINELRRDIGKSSVSSFKPFFEERLISRLKKSNEVNLNFSNWDKSLVMSFRQIAIAAVIILVILITYNLQNGNSYSINKLLGESQADIEYAFDPVQNIFGSEQ